MVPHDIREIETALNYVDVTYSGEGFVVDALNATADALMESFKFIKSVATLDLNSFFDDKIKTDLYVKVRSLHYDLGKIKKVSFLDVKDQEVSVTPGFETKLYEKVDFLNSELPKIIKESLSLFSDYEDMLANFITSKDRRNIVIYDIRQFKGTEAKQKKEFSSIERLTSGGSDGLTTIGKLIGNIPTYVKDVDIILSLMKTFINEKDLKGYLGQIRNLYDQVNAVIEIINTEPVKNGAINELISYNTLIANQYTLLSKLYYLFFEVSQIVVNVSKPLKEKL